MKLQDLKGKDREEKSELINAQPKVLAIDMLNEPQKMRGKILVFCKGCIGFDKNRICLRVFEYIEKEEEWKVCDIDLSDMFPEAFVQKFTKNGLLETFKRECQGEAFLFDQDE